MGADDDVSTESHVLKRLSPLALYGGVLSGMYLFQSGWAAIAGYHLAICVVLTGSRGWGDARKLISGWQTGLAIPMLLFCLASGALILLLWPLVRLENASLDETLLHLGLEGWPWLAFVAYYSLINPWLEELFWRGWYPTVIERPFASDLLFAGYHVFVLVLFVEIGWALLSFVALASTAAIWRWLARRTGGLIVPCVSHLVADVSIIAAAIWLTSG